MTIRTFDGRLYSEVLCKQGAVGSRRASASRRTRSVAAVNKRGNLAAVAALACVAAGVLVGVGIGGGRRGTTPKRPAKLLEPLRSRALAGARVEERSTALVTVGNEVPARSGFTYEVVRAGGHSRWKLAIVASGATALITGAVLIGVALSNPQVTALAAPSVAYPGTTATISYAAAGFGSMSYRFDAPSSHRSGSLSAHQGAIGVPIVDRDANGDVVVVVRAAGPFGTDVRVARIKVLAHPRDVVVMVPSNAARIDALTLSSPTAASGERIGIHYRSNATGGSVSLRDARGGLWQSKVLSATGYTELRAPTIEHDTPFNVVVQARRNGRAIENSVALLVTGTTPSAKPDVVAPAASRVAAARDIPAVAQSGAIVVTSAGADRVATIVELTGKDGIELQRATPRADGTTELRMPVVTAPQTYLVSVSYQNGAGRESTFYRIRVVPAKAMPRVLSAARR